MPVFQIEITEKLSRVVYVEADNVDIAINNIRDCYNRNGIVLNSNDIGDTVITCINVNEANLKTIDFSPDNLQDVKTTLDYVLNSEKTHYDEESCVFEHRFIYVKRDPNSMVNPAEHHIYAVAERVSKLFK